MLHTLIIDYMNEVPPLKSVPDQPIQSSSPAQSTHSAPLNHTDSPKPQTRSGLSTAWINLFVFVLGIIGGILLTITYPAIMNKSQSSPSQNLLTTPTKTPTPTPYPIPTLAIIDTATDSAITADWNDYTNKNYVFKFPKGSILHIYTGQPAYGIESASIQFMGPTQVASGRVETELGDGYTFRVVLINSNTSNISQQYVEDAIIREKESCPDDNPFISPITQKLIDGIKSVYYSSSISDIKPEISSVYMYGYYRLSVFHRMSRQRYYQLSGKQRQFIQY